MVTTSIFFIVQKSYIFICDDFKLKIHVSILLWSWEFEGGNSLTFLFLRTIVSTACGNLAYPMCLPVYRGQGVHTLRRLHQQWWSFFFFLHSYIDLKRPNEPREDNLNHLYIFFQVHWLESYFLPLLWLYTVRILKFKTRNKKSNITIWPPRFSYVWSNLNSFYFFN